MGDEIGNYMSRISCLLHLLVSGVIRIVPSVLYKALAIITFNYSDVRRYLESNDKIQAHKVKPILFFI